MKHNYFKTLLAATALCSSMAGWAVDYPTYPTQTLTDGGKYILCNLANPTGYMARTSWDGAYYFLGATDSKYQTLELTAKYDSESSRWMFITDTIQHPAVEADPDNGIEAQEAYTSYTYMGIPSGTDNLNGNLTEEAYWTVTPSTVATGFYMLTVDDGNLNANCIGMNLHLNSGGQYFVVSEFNNGWYPDFYGGYKLDEEGQPVIVYDKDDNPLKVMADSTSMNWAFVSVADVPTYVQIGTAWNTLNSFEKNNCSIEGYADGFKATLAAAETAFKAGDYETMNAMLTAKSALYQQIQKAIVQEPDALAKAIAAAQTAFNENTDATVVDAATAALKKACDDYAMGLGDITSMGKNMSFEDLTAQDGATTVGLAAPPAGWNVFINGTQVTTKDEVSETIKNWHGVNGDCSGDIKEGDYGFGIWTATIPDYKICQTISGLDNGAYTIKCGLMVGANNAGSRRTTQRVFGNLNSTYFASEEEYDATLLDAFEQTNFAGLSEPLTDTEMQEISVQAYVYDGTLTFGIHTDGDYAAALRETGNANSGDGWFKCDNFTISKDGANHDLAYETATAIANSFDNYNAQKMPASEETKIDDLAKKYNVTKSMSDAELEALLVGFTDDKTQLSTIEAGISAYAQLKNKLEETEDRLELCEDYAGYDNFNDVYDDVNGKYDEGTYETSQVDSVINALDEAYQTCLHSGAAEGMDVSDLILNRGFEDLSAQDNTVSNGVTPAPNHWTLKLNGVVCQSVDEIKAQGVTGWCAINSGDGINVEDNGQTYTHQYTEGTHLWGIWNASIPTVELSQTLTGLEEGTYTLTADVMARNTDWSGTNLTTQRIFANGCVTLYGAEDDYVPSTLENTSSHDIYQMYDLNDLQGMLLDDEEGTTFINYAGWDANNNDVLLRTLTVQFGVDESGEATIGFRTDNLNGCRGIARTETAAGWFKVDNFTLTFESKQKPSNMDKAIEATPVKAVLSATRGTSALYDLSGRRVSKAQRGIYIKDGKKVIK